MKSYFFYLSFLLSITTVSSIVIGAAASPQPSVLITGVLYNPIKSESGGEAVDLYNPNEQSIDVSGWTLMTETSAADVTFPQGSIIPGKSYYLAADSGWSSNKDNQEWPLADYEEAMTLTNTNAGVALSNGSHIIDAVGWGDAASIEPGLFEGEPHSGSKEGELLGRIQEEEELYKDTQHNALDFTSSSEAFHNKPGSVPSNHIALLVSVGGALPVIDSVRIPDDEPTTPGIQVLPVPKQNKSIMVESIISHPNGNSQIKQVSLTFLGSVTNLSMVRELNATSSLYASQIVMKYYDLPGNYSALIQAADKSGFRANYSLNFSYASLIAMELDTSSLQFNALPGGIFEIGGDNREDTRSNTTVHNVGNMKVHIALSGSNLTSARANPITVSAVSYTFNSDYFSSLGGTLSHLPQTVPVGIAPAAKQPLSFRLAIPTATSPGNYSGTITLLAVKST